MAESIFQTRNVRKAPSDKVILDEKTLNFGPGAKISLVSANGARTSRVARICGSLAANISQYCGS